MSSITDTAKEFFVACEAGKGWEACKGYCTSDATFSAQAEPLADIKTLRDYTEWMKGFLATPRGAHAGWLMPLEPPPRPLTLPCAGDGIQEGRLVAVRSL